MSKDLVERFSQFRKGVADVSFSTELFKMVCEADEPDVNIGIPVVMLPQDAGESLRRSFEEKKNGRVHSTFY